MVEKVRFVMGLVPRLSVKPAPSQAGGFIIALAGFLDLSGKVLDLFVTGEQHIERFDEQLLEERCTSALKRRRRRWRSSSRRSVKAALRPDRPGCERGDCSRASAWPAIIGLNEVEVSRATSVMRCAMASRWRVSGGERRQAGARLVAIVIVPLVVIGCRAGRRHGAERRHGRQRLALFLRANSRSSPDRHAASAAHAGA